MPETLAVSGLASPPGLDGGVVAVQEPRGKTSSFPDCCAN